MIFISHDLSVVKHISDRIAVMYLGRIVEIGPSVDVFERPVHPYTKALVSAVPIPNPEREKHRQVASSFRVTRHHPSTHPQGCTFHPRCPYAQEDAVKSRVSSVHRIHSGRAPCNLHPVARDQSAA